jgi:triacylglycerol esterase/lipase EstA (alpha/beta hydrolase family)
LVGLRGAINIVILDCHIIVQINDSVYELHKPKDTTKVQVVFFHGLQKEDYTDAHLRTWQSEDGSLLWPQTWLVEDIPGAHVLSVSYSLTYNVNGSLDMDLIVENLVSDLLQVGIGQVPQCAVVLVGHSIGGLVIKALCKHAHEEFSRSQGLERDRLQLFLNNVGGIFYYSTPHHGSGIAKILAKKVSSPLFTYFETLSKDTARLNSHFEIMCRVNYQHWKFAGLGEGVPTNLVIKA